jgi:hypothetical protein
MTCDTIIHSRATLLLCWIAVIVSDVIPLWKITTGSARFKV